MIIVACYYLLKPQETSNPDKEDINTASITSAVPEQTKSLGSIGIGVQQATNVLQSVVGTLKVGYTYIHIYMYIYICIYI